MPFRNEARHLPGTLDSISAQTVDRERLRLVAVDNGSDDGGGKLIELWGAAHGVPTRVLVEPEPSIPHALNRALSEVLPDEIVVRLDAHTIYSPTYLAAIDDAFARLDDGVWCVGGAPDVAPTGDFSRALHAALLTSPMGLGPADYRDGQTSDKAVQTVYLGAWRPGILQRLGGFDEGWPANEDSELNERIREAGGLVYRIDARSQKVVTRGAWAAARQWARYGFWRARTFRRHPSAIRARHVVPPLTLALATGLALSPARAVLAPLFGAYALATYLVRPRGQPFAVTAATFAYFPVVQCGYALGLLAGGIAPGERAAPEPTEAT